MAAVESHLQDFQARTGIEGTLNSRVPTLDLEPEAATALMRLILRDFGSYLVDPDRRQLDGQGRPRRVLMVIEEAGAVAGPVSGAQGSFMA